MRRILVTTDGTKNSKLAFPAAAFLAKKLGAKIHLLFVAEDPVFVPPPGVAWSAVDLRGEMRTWGEKVLEAAAKDFAKLGVAKVGREIRTGAPANTILAAAKANRADLIVMSTHGRRGMERALIGSVAEQVVRKSPVPVFSVRGRPGRKKNLGTGRTRILLPVDGMPGGEGAQRFATTLAKNLGASVDVLFVAEPPMMVPPHGLMVRYPILNVPEVNLEWGKKLTQDLARRMKRQGVKGATATVRTGHPAEAILRHQKRGKHDLIIMGTHGRRGLSRAWLGSVAEEVLRRTGVPLISVRMNKGGKAAPRKKGRKSFTVI